MENHHKIKMGILDFGLGEEKRNSLLRIQDLINYVVQADQLNFSRFWLAEHHFHNPLLAWSDPTPLIPVLAMHTQQIRIGTGGLLMSLHQPYQAATSFKLYNNIFSNRIDLGLANGNSFGKFLSSRCILPGYSFEKNCEELLWWLHEEDRIFEEEKIVIPPYKGYLPDVWSMSTSLEGMERATRLGTNFVRSIFHYGCDTTPNKDLLHAYRQRYHAKHGHYPKIMLAVSGTCQKNSQLAELILNGLSLDPKLHLVGDEDFIGEELLRLSENFGINEFLWKDIGKNLEDKLASLHCLSNILTSVNYEKA